jgi:NitT/TauT family transport system ATP-binding protein
MPARQVANGAGLSPVSASDSVALEIEANGVSKVYSTADGPVRALDRVSLGAKRGEFVSLLGPSGCGKSTFLMIAAGLLSRSSGSVRVGGEEVDGPVDDLGIVFQSPVLLDWRTALDNVLLQAEARKLPRDAARDRAGALLKSVGLGGFEEKYPHELSGGMRQRVSICRALLHEPRQLLMDEPFGALDALTRDQMILDLQRLCLDRQLTVLFVTHSIDEAVFLSDKVVIMSPRPGRVAKEISVDLPRPRTLALRESAEFSAYTKQILNIFLEYGVLHEE